MDLGNFEVYLFLFLDLDILGIYFWRIWVYDFVELKFRLDIYLEGFGFWRNTGGCSCDGFRRDLDCPHVPDDYTAWALSLFLP